MNRQELMKLLVCPQCRGKLIEDDAGLRCDACELLYPIRNGIPVMLVDQAIHLARNSAPGEESCAS